MESDRQQTDTAPGVEPLMDEREFGRLGPHQHRRERGLETTSGWRHGMISQNQPTAMSRQSSKSNAGRGPIIQ